MQEQLKAIMARVTEELKNIQDTGALEQLRVSVMGKKGELTQILRGMGSLPAEERPAMANWSIRPGPPWNRPWRSGFRCSAKWKSKSAWSRKRST